MSGAGSRREPWLLWFCSYFAVCCDTVYNIGQMTERDISRWDNRMLELGGQLKVAGQRGRQAEIDVAGLGLSTAGLEAIHRSMDAIGYRSQMRADIAWVVAMKKAGLSEEEMLAIFEAKDLYSRERMDYTQRQVDVPEEDEGSGL